MNHTKLTPTQLAAVIASVVGTTLTPHLSPLTPSRKPATPKPLTPRKVDTKKPETIIFPTGTVSMFRRQVCLCCGSDPWALEGEFVTYTNAQGTATRISRETAPRSIASNLPHEVIWENDPRHITMCPSCAHLSRRVEDLLVNLDLSTTKAPEQLEIWL